MGTVDPRRSGGDRPLGTFDSRCGGGRRWLRGSHREAIGTVPHGAADYVRRQRDGAGVVMIGVRLLVSVIEGIVARGLVLVSRLRRSVFICMMAEVIRGLALFVMRAIQAGVRPRRL